MLRATVRRAARWGAAALGRRRTAVASSVQCQLRVSGVPRVVLINTRVAADSEAPEHEPLRGEHVFVERGSYSHHGIACGDGTVIDFAGLGPGKNTPVIRRVTLVEFAQGD